MLHEANYFVFDLETGGLWSHNNPITEIALIQIDVNLKIVSELETYVKPYNDLILTREALQLTGIKETDLNEKGVEAKQLYINLVALFKSAKVGRYGKPVLVGHNISSFDRKFLEYLFNLFDTPKADGTNPLYKYVEDFMVDTMWMSRMKNGHKEVDNHKLEGACRREDIILIDGHRAMSDTKANAALFIAYMEQFRGAVNGKANNIQEVENSEKTREYQFK